MNGFVKFMLILVILSTLCNLVGQVILWAPPVVDSDIAQGGGSGSNDKDPGNNGNENKPGEEEIQKPVADVQISASVTPDENGQVPAGGVSINGVTASANVPEGVQMEEGATELTLTINNKEDSEADLDLNENEVATSLDVHMAGVSTDNAVPMEVKLLAAMVKGLNSTSVKLYHVENGETVEMTRVANNEEFTAHNQFKYDPATGDVTLYIAGFSEIAMIADTVNAWEGELDYDWYDASKTELYIANADQLAGFGAIVGGMAKDENGNFFITYTDEDGDVHHNDYFDGKTVKLIADINLGDDEEHNNVDVIFYPIGYWNSDGTYEKTNQKISSGFYTFEGTFDGNGNTIKNFYQNTWEMKGDHDWYDANLQYFRDGMGLFGRLYKATVKNLTIKNFSSDGEITTTGCVAAYADGATLENIAIFNCNPRVYNIGNGGIVGCVGWYAKEANLKTTFKNITVDNTNKISALWGSYDVACGGIVGQYYPTSGQSSAGKPANGGIEMINCHVGAQMDVYNDVCANYQYYAYRYTGMLIGSVRENVTIDGHSYPKMDGITASGCTVHFGTWNDYYYCEIIDNTTASYTHDYQMSRLTEIKAIDGTTITYLDGTTGSVPASGRANYVIVDYTKGHGTENATCYHFKDGAVWTHDMGGIQTGIDENGDGQDDLKEDKQHIYLEFNNLVTGYGWGVTSKGVGDLAGVVILDRENPNSVEKFEGKVNSPDNNFDNNKEYTLGDIFSFIDNGVELIPDALTVGITNLDENGNVVATITYDVENWANGTIIFSGAGSIQITIQDYYFCIPTTITVKIEDRTPEEKFEVIFNNGDFLHRVGNSGAFEISKLFAAIDGTDIQNDNVEVSITAVNGTGASGTYTHNSSNWKNGTIKFSGTGVVKVTITDNDYCTPTELYLEVVNATNVTGATSATSNNVVLLNDCTFSTITVSGGYTLYGNGFTMTCTSDYSGLNIEYGFVSLENGTLDNIQIVVPNYSYAILFESNKSESGNVTEKLNNSTRYFNVYSAVRTEGNSKILNSYISGGRAAVYAVSGTLLVDNTTIEGGAAANMHINAACAVTLRDVTMIQEPKQATVHDTTKTLMGLSVVVICDGNGLCTAITLEGTLRQYAWAREDYSQYVPEKGKSFVSTVLKKSAYLHEITYSDGVTANSINLGFLFLPSGDVAPKNPINNNMIVDNRSNENNVPYGATDISGSAYVYSYSNINGTSSDVATKPDYTPTEYGPTAPTLSYTDTNENRIFETVFDSTTGKWVSSLKVDVDAGNYTFDFAKLLAQKYGNNLSYTVELADGTAVGNTVLLNSAITNEYVLTITDKQIYDQNGNITGETVKHTYVFRLLSTKTSLPEPTWTSKTLNGTPYIVVDSKGGDWNCAVPVLDGLKIKYWSKKQNKEVELDLADVVTAAGLIKGLQNSTNNNITITVADEYTLTITTTGFKTNDNGKPVVVNGKLYFTVSSSSNYVSTKTTDRTPSISYTFTDANNSEPITLSTSMTVTYATYKSKQYKYSDFCNGTLKEASSCVTPDTLVTLADGSQKRIDEVTYNDQLLVWDFYNGKYAVAPSAIIFNHGYANNTIIKLSFSDGTVVKVANLHQFFDCDLNEFVSIDADSVAQYVGHSFAKQSGDGYTTVTLEDYEVSVKYEGAYGIISAFHYNIIVEGMISTDFMLEDYDLFNYFEIGENMTFNKDQMQADIDKYGLYTYEDFADYLTYEQFVGFNVQYFKIAVGKGNYTYEGILDLIAEYLK